MAEIEQKEPALIVGGGIGGLAAAPELARQGCRVRLIERPPTSSRSAPACSSAPRCSGCSRCKAVSCGRAHSPARCAGR